MMLKGRRMIYSKEGQLDVLSRFDVFIVWAQKGLQREDRVL
jgi:hypothetical protein